MNIIRAVFHNLHISSMNKQIPTGGIRGQLLSGSGPADSPQHWAAVQLSRQLKSHLSMRSDSFHSLSHSFSGTYWSFFQWTFIFFAWGPKLRLALRRVGPLSPGSYGSQEEKQELYFVGCTAREKLRAVTWRRTLFGISLKQNAQGDRKSTPGRGHCRRQGIKTRVLEPSWSFFKEWGQDFRNKSWWCL